MWCCWPCAREPGLCCLLGGFIFPLGWVLFPQIICISLGNSRLFHEACPTANQLLCAAPGWRGSHHRGRHPEPCRAVPYRAEAAQQVGNRDRGTGTGAGTAWGGYAVPNGGEAGVTTQPHSVSPPGRARGGPCLASRPLGVARQRPRPLTRAAPPAAPIATAGGGGHLGGGGGAMSGSKARAAAAAGPEKKPPPGTGGALSRLRGRRGSGDSATRPGAPWTESELLALETVRPEHVLGLCRVTESE